MKKKFIAGLLSTTMLAVLMSGCQVSTTTGTDEKAASTDKATEASKTDAKETTSGEVEEITWMFWDDLEATEDLITKGYKEVIEYLENCLSFEETVEKIKLNTRHYAKRQITFFKKLPGLEYLEYCQIDQLAKRIVERI